MGCADHEATLAGLAEASAALRVVAVRLGATEAELRHLAELREHLDDSLRGLTALREREVVALEKAAEADRRRAVAVEQWARIPAGALDVLSKLVSTRAGIALLALLVMLAGVVVVGSVDDLAWTRLLRLVEAYQCAPSS